MIRPQDAHSYAGRKTRPGYYAEQSQRLFFLRAADAMRRSRCDAVASPRESVAGIDGQSSGSAVQNIESGSHLARGSANPALNLRNSRGRCGIRLPEILAFGCSRRHAKNRLQVWSRLIIYFRRSYRLCHMCSRRQKSHSVLLRWF
jgi:hypothetical protein